MTQQALLNELETALREVLHIVRTQVAPLPEAALLVRSQPDGWNMLEIFAHLNALSDYYLSHIDRSIHKAKARRWENGGEAENNWAGRRALRIVSVGSKSRKTPKKFNFLRKPVEKDEVKRFLINSERLLRSLQLSKEIDINRPKVPAATFPHLKFNLGGLYQYLVAHTQRHILQFQALVKTV
jgi:hypothetical protein